MRRYVPRGLAGLAVVITLLLLATACGAAATATPRPTDTPRLATPQVVDAPRAAAGPTPDKPAAVGKPAPMSEEQSREELKSARFSTDEWGRTNFRIRSVPLREFTGGGPGKDDIPPIDAPKFETVAQAERWLDDREAVQVVEIKDDARAYPQQILIWHEVVNDTVGGEPVTITYWPLCNSAFVFRRTVGARVLDFGTTGLLRFSNLVMYDRQTESWWQEFNGEAIVGDMTGTRLELLPLSIVSWKEFKSTFPQGKVLSKDTGFRRPYGSNPYTFYDSSSDPFLYGGPKDQRLPALERVVAIDMGTESLTVPYSVLEKEPIVHYTLAGRDLVVFFKKGTASTLDKSDIADSRDVGAVGVFDSVVEGKRLTFRLRDGRILDDQTESTWNLLGKAEAGPLAGKELRPLVYRAAQFWFSWAVFKPDTFIYLGK